MLNLANTTLSLQAQITSSSIAIGQPGGISVVFRLMRPEDVRLVLEMHDRLSPDSLYFRYLRTSQPSTNSISFTA